MCLYCLLALWLAYLLEYLIQVIPFLDACYKPVLDITAALIDKLVPRSIVIQKLPGVIKGEGILHQSFNHHFKASTSPYNV